MPARKSGVRNWRRPSAQVVKSYVDHWNARIQEVTSLAHEISSLLGENEYGRAATLRGPQERRGYARSQRFFKFFCDSG
jgi:hypothetical protein